ARRRRARARVATDLRVLGIGRDDGPRPRRARAAAGGHRLDAALPARALGRAADLRMRRAVMAFATAALLVGCGSSPGNTIELTISGAGPKRSVLVTEEGQGSCNGGKLRQVPSADVL